MSIYFWERERAWAGEGHRDREKDGLSLGCSLGAWRRRSLNSLTMRSWPEPESDTQPTEPSRCPGKMFLINTSSLLLCVCFFGREREREAERQRETDRGRESQAGLHCQCGAQTHTRSWGSHGAFKGFKLKLWDHNLGQNWVWWLTYWATQVPLVSYCYRWHSFC